MNNENFLIGTKAELTGLTGHNAHLNGLTGRITTPFRFSHTNEYKEGMVGFILDKGQQSNLKKDTFNINSKFIKIIEGDTIIIKLQYFLSGSGLSVNREEYIAEEKPSTYNVYYHTNSHLRINKRELKTPMTILVNNHERISYYAWCLPEDERQCGEMLRNAVIRFGTDIENEANAMFKELNKLKNNS